MRLALLAVIGAATIACGQTPEELFTGQIRPVLERDCQGCHGGAQTLSQLDLRSRASALQGGTRGAALVAGDARASLLIRALEGQPGAMQMPPGGAAKKLPPETIAAFRAWIDQGAVWPEKPAAAGPKWNLKPEELWAWRPLRPFDESESIDHFLEAALGAKGIRPAPLADRRTLIRRVTIDLTGLPPAPEEVEAFVADQSAEAWPRLVDRLLASPRHGERWGRHWLDVVRYADTGGYSNDFERPNAWRYRDYVIRAFNSDKPYDQFIREQVAGDELYPGHAEALIATGFLRSGPWEHTAMSVEAVTRQMFLDDVTHATASTFLGVTLGCARCHDHKFDPLPTRDYYRMQSVFASTEFARPALGFLPVENTAGFEQGAGRVEGLLNRALGRMGEYREMSAQALMKKKGVARREELTKAELNAAMANGDGLSAEQFEDFKLYQKHSQLFRQSEDRYAPKAFAVSSGPRDGATDGGPNLRYAQRAEYQPAAVHVLPGGNIQAPAEAVTPGVLSAVEQYSGYPAPPIPSSTEGRRAALAKWIADERNPLTARVMVNRVWQYHFGRGLAADPSNFGKMGKKPTHPELLDWLARRFVRDGWSVKKLHRLILMTQAYRRASANPGASGNAAAVKDPGNTLLSYFSPRRVEAEVIRDSVLAVAGELSLDAGGPGVFPQLNDEVARQPQHRMGSLAPAYQASPRKRDRNRRTIYTFQQRSLADPMVEVFNGPAMDLSCERRETSTVPTQGFALLNSQFVNDMALALAARVAREASSLDGQISRAFALVYGRAATAAELGPARAHVARMTEWHRRTPPPARAAARPLVHKINSELTGEVFEFHQDISQPEFEWNLHATEVSAEVRALGDLALVLLNGNEFVYVY